MESACKIAIILAVALTLFSCAKKDRIKETEKILKAKGDMHVSQFMLDKFNDHRIIMLGDDGYGQKAYRWRLLSFLNDWLDAVKSGKTTMHNLVLVLDTDLIHVQTTRKYMLSHDFHDIIGDTHFYYPELTTSGLETYWELGDFIKKIVQYNSNGGNIKFDILGPDTVIDIENWSQAKSDSFPASAQDLVSSNNIINYLKANPDTKALAFFCTSHLMTADFKNKADTVGDKRYYMGHYLAEAFKGQLYEFAQFSLDKFRMIYGISTWPESSFVIEQKYLNKILGDDRSPINAEIINVIDIKPTVSLHFVKSKNLGYLALDEIKTLFPRNHYNYSHMAKQAAEYLSMLTGNMEYLSHGSDSGQIMKYVPAWEKWLNDPKNDVVKEIVAEAPGKHLVDLMKSTNDKFVEVNSEYLYVLTTGKADNYDLRATAEWKQGYLDDYDKDSNNERADRFEFYDHCLDKYSNKIIVTDLVQLLWVGTDQEKQEAIQELRKRTNRSFTTPPEWMQWWRENYDNL